MNKEIKFKKIQKVNIDNIIDYIVDYVKLDAGDEEKGISSDIQISIGCDSSCKDKHVNYALTILFYNNYKHDGGHYIYKTLKMPRHYLWKNKRINQWRVEVDDVVFNSDVDKLKTKLHDKKQLNQNIFARLWNEVEYAKELALYIDEGLQGKYYIKHDKNAYDGSVPYRLPIIHVDFNPESNGGKNKSADYYQAAMGTFIAEGFKVVGKPDAPAASSCADKFV